MNVTIQQRIASSTRTWMDAGAHHLAFNAMATRCQIVAGGSAGTVAAFFKEAVHWVAEFESRFSRFVPDSIISRINAAAGKEWVTIDSETERLLAMCHEAHFITSGVFDPTALPLIQLWNWKAERPVIPDDAAIAAAKQRVGWKKIQRAPGKVFLPEGVSLDLGGIGKEYAVDMVAALAARANIQSVLVDFGHDIVARGTPPDGRPAWHVGLENPQQPGSCWGSVGASNIAVATSGDYLRRFEINGRRFGHIIDARNGCPVASNQRSVTVLAPTCTMAGILSTAAFVLGPELGMRLIDSVPGAAGCILTDTKRIQNRRFHEYLAA